MKIALSHDPEAIHVLDPRPDEHDIQGDMLEIR